MVVENYLSARARFNERYEGNTVQWTGAFMGMRTSAVGNAESIMVKMEPSETTANQPDIVLTSEKRPEGLRPG